MEAADQQSLDHGGWDDVGDEVVECVRKVHLEPVAQTGHRLAYYESFKLGSEVLSCRIGFA